MAGSLRILVLTPEKTLVDRTARSLRIPGADGSFGVLPGHAPLLAVTAPGELRVTGEDGVETTYFLAHGVAEVQDNVVRIACRSGEPVTDIDLARAEEAAKRARERMSVPVPDVDLVRAEFALMRAIARERIARMYR